jgi:hypothetical protein
MNKKRRFAIIRVDNIEEIEDMNKMKIPTIYDKDSKSLEEAIAKCHNLCKENIETFRIDANRKKKVKV